jgi:hypothetical protein
MRVVQWRGEDGQASGTPSLIGTQACVQPLSLSLSSLKLERVKHIKTIAIMFSRYMITSKFKHA